MNFCLCVLILLLVVAIGQTNVRGKKIKLKVQINPRGKSLPIHIRIPRRKYIIKCCGFKSCLQTNKTAKLKTTSSTSKFSDVRSFGVNNYNFKSNNNYNFKSNNNYYNKSYYLHINHHHYDHTFSLQFVLYRLQQLLSEQSNTKTNFQRRLQEIIKLQTRIFYIQCQCVEK
ncbi:Hypothetical predicted protein [Cloeon dipterum]|uniref:Uncharacterized protein n=1 Tax=Cloeon dipterum TaxID=197152 RepID=A0A8S1DY78_9INSE|nr:Hypothetical predicted protein [Cloeon dipterum]